MNGLYSPVKTRGVVPHDIGDPGELCIIGYHEVTRHICQREKKSSPKMEIVILNPIIIFSYEICSISEIFSIMLNMRNTFELSNCS